MANVAFNARTWTDAPITTTPIGTVTVARPASGVLYVRIVRGGVVVSEIKTWATTGPVTVPRDYEVGDTVRVWVGAATSQTVAVTTVNR